jgi:hypothetical protein
MKDKTLAEQPIAPVGLGPRQLRRIQRKEKTSEKAKGTAPARLFCEEIIVSL